MNDRAALETAWNNLPHHREIVAAWQALNEQRRG